MTLAPEVKAEGSHYNPQQPRDRKGRWVEEGAEVRNSITRAVGTVTRIHPGSGFHETSYEVRDTGGKTQTWQQSAVDVIRNPDGSAPAVTKPGAAHVPGPSPEHAQALAGVIAQVHQPERQAADTPDTNAPSGQSPGHATSLGAAIAQVHLPPSGHPATLDAAIEQVHNPVDGHGTHTAETAGALTDAQKVAIAQKWKLPKGPVADLQAQLAQVEVAPTPSVADLVDNGMGYEQAIKEAKRLARNANVNAWRARTKLQAAIDTQVGKDKGQGAPALHDAVAKVADKPELPSPAAELASLDKAFPGKDLPHPKALYTPSQAEIDAGQAGPGAIPAGHAWHDQFLAYAGPDSSPIPVHHLDVQGGYTVESGWAQTIGGKAYLVENKPGESSADAAARMNQAHAALTTALQYAPKEHQGAQRAVALLNGANPQDPYWEQVYGLAGFQSDAVGGNGSTIVFNGNAPDIATLAHEYGHNVDNGGDVTSQALSTQNTPVLPGQQMTWKNAMLADSTVSNFYTGRFTETRPGKPITLGAQAVTEYGGAGKQEDFAESVRLWLRDRRYGKIGYDPSTGDNVRFADLFPERAKILDARFGTKTDFNTPARQRRIKEMKESFTQVALNAADSGTIPPWEALGEGWDAAPFGPKYGLDGEGAWTAFTAAMVDVNAHFAEEEAAAKAAADAAAAKAKVKQEAAHAAAAAQVKNFEEAYAKGLIDKSELTKLKDRRRVRAYHLTKKGVPEEQAKQQALAWEQAYIAEHWPAGVAAGPNATSVPVAFDKPWVGKQLEPHMKGESGLPLINESGTKKHPLAVKQSNTVSQAKANIAAELASRVNNKEDWEAFRQYGKNRPPELGGYQSVPAWEDTTAKKRQDLLDREMSTRVQSWAGTSGDTSHPAVIMQMAAKDEFALPGAHPAPRMAENEYNKWVTDFYTKTTRDWYRRVLRAMYEHTQEDFKARGMTEVKLYRGMVFTALNAPDWAKPDGKAKRPRLQPINSWSTSRSTAQMFSAKGSVVFEATIPVELVVGSALTGFGCRGEFEFVVMDADGLAKANNYEGTK